MKKKYLFLSLLGVLIVQLGFAQQKTITGRVVDEKGLPLSNATVIIENTPRGTVADFDGNFAIKAAEGEVVVVSYIGYTDGKITVGNANNYNVALNPDDELEEVVVSALGISREKKSLGYSVQEIKGDAVSTVKDANIVNSLSGKVAGAQVTGNPGTLGGSSRIILRGINSISGNNQPLWIVDGTPIDNSNYNFDNTQTDGGGIDYGNAAADINPEDIASISVLKGASAAALYGSRAANGVILVTTKSGENRKGIGVSVSTGISFTKVAVLPKYQNEYGGGYEQEFGSYQGQPIVNYAADESWGPKMEGQMVRQWYSWFTDDPDYGKLTPFLPHKNNVKDFYETGVTTNNNVALTGGNDKANFRLSLTNFGQTGTIPVQKLIRNTVAVSAESKLIDKLKASANFNYVNTKNDNIPSQGYSGASGAPKNVVTSFNEWFQRQLDIEKLRNYKTADGIDRSWNINSPTNLKGLYWNNPFWTLNESPANMERQRIYGNISLKYMLTDNLSVQTWLHIDYYTDRREGRVASGSIKVSRYSENVRELRDNNYEFLFQYDYDFSDDISITANFGGNSRQELFYGNGMGTVGGLSLPNFFNVRASIDRPNIVDYEEKKVVNSLYGIASIAYKGTYYLDLSARNDWSSTLPKENNSYFYPSVTGSFLFSEVINLPFLSFGKLRGSWAVTGNDTAPYQLVDTYNLNGNYGNIPAYGVNSELKNPDLKSETTTSVEFGIEMKFFQNRLGFDLTYYDIKAKDQILNLNVSNTSGYRNSFINAGLLTNKGWEFALNIQPIDKELTWGLSLNWAKNSNEVVELYKGLENYIIASWGGPSINAKIGRPYGTWITDGFKYHENGQRIVDKKGSYVRLTDQTYGSYLPDWTGGVKNSLSYKNLSFSVLIDFQKGGLLYSVSNLYGAYSGLLPETVGLNDKGNPIRDPVSKGGGVKAEGVFEDGTPNTVYVDAQKHFKHLARRREYYLYDASFIKLREMSLTYRFPAALLRKLSLEDASVSLTGRNLAILKKNVPNVDPESAYGSGNIQGFEHGQHPSTRTIGLGLNFKF